jgi:2-C-methyl-D-erythritol 2,4-cyclodiphosphate synthase
MNIRIGHGFDIHRLQTGGELAVGGVIVAKGISPIAHSDGDVAIHALIDALFGAAGLGDIGEMFPNTDETWKGAKSMTLLSAAYARVKQGGFEFVNADITILAERPKLKSFKPKMIESLKNVLGGGINIKAGTNEGCDAVGRGEAIAAHAVVLLRGSGT